MATYLHFLLLRNTIPLFKSKPMFACRKCTYYKITWLHRSIITAIFFLVFEFPVIAQNKGFQGKVLGKVTGNDDQPLSSATVFMKRANDSAVAKVTATDSLGQFEITGFKPGRYFITTGYLKYHPAYSGVFTTDSMQPLVTLAAIKMSPLVNILDQAEVKGVKPLIERKIDRVIFNVSNSIIASAASDATEVLSKAPGVRVDQDAISLIGKSGIKVMVNDRLLNFSGEDLINYLKTIPAANIQSIEVITNPPARYDAEGNSGLVNIRTIKIKNNGFTATLRAAYSQSFYARGETGAVFDYRLNKTNIYGNVTYMKGRSRPVERLQVFYPQQTWEQEDKRIDYLNTRSLQLGIDHRLSKKTVLGVLYTGSFRNPDIDEEISNRVYRPASGITDSVLNTSAATAASLKWNGLNLNMQTSLNKPGRQLNIDFDYFDYSNNRHRDFTTKNYLGSGVPTGENQVNKTTSGQHVQLTTVKADFDWPVKKINLTFGAKLSFIGNNSDNQFATLVSNTFENDPNRSNTFRYKEENKALYFSAAGSANKWEYQFGLRGEHTFYRGNSLTTGQKTSLSYARAFPTFYLLYKASDNHVFTFNYGRRINRPGYLELNPFRWYLNNNMYTEGYPFLQPSYNNNAELAYSLKNKYNFTLYVELVNDIADQIAKSDTAAKVIAFIRRNIGTSRAYGFTANATNSLAKWWSITNAIYSNYYEFSSVYENVKDKRSQFTTYLSTSHQFTFNKSRTVTGSLDFFYQFPVQSGFARINGNYGLDAGFRALLLKKKVTLSITAGDIFRTQKTIIAAQVLNTSTRADNYYDLRRFRVMLTYKFTSGKMQAKRSRGTGNDDEKNRIR